MSCNLVYRQLKRSFLVFFFSQEASVAAHLSRTKALVVKLEYERKIARSVFGELRLPRKK